MAYKLYYFNFKGLAEPIRYLLSYGNINFEDNSVTNEDWPNFKDSEWIQLSFWVLLITFLQTLHLNNFRCL